MEYYLVNSRFPGGLCNPPAFHIHDFTASLVLIVPALASIDDPARPECPASG